MASSLHQLGILAQDRYIFDFAAARKVVSDSIKHWGLGDEPVLRSFVLA